ncbi:MAG: hypothetical protein JW969_15215, partial [Spirochaetales bacterium]|nr:hypothetical protein [Spirochaetales bacterium]
LIGTSCTDIGTDNNNCSTYPDDIIVQSYEEGITQISCAEYIGLDFVLSIPEQATSITYCIDELLHNDAVEKLDRSLQITLTVQPVCINFPLIFAHRAPYHPHEEIIKIKNDFVGVCKCVDDPGPPCPSCGCTYKDGEPVPGFQGFCLNKDAEQLLENEIWRGEDFLGEQSTILNSFSTAHCYRDGDLYFDGYEIEEPARMFKISIQIGLAETVNYSCDLSPGTPVFASLLDDPGLELNAAGELNGDFSDYTGFSAVFSNYLVYIPAEPANHPYVIDKDMNLLLIPREMVTLDGSGLDKIGVSREAFNTQGSVPLSSTGDGLHNQLFDCHNQDLETILINPDAETVYMLAHMKGFQGTFRYIDDGAPFLRCFFSNIQTAVLTVHIDYESLVD